MAYFQDLPLEYQDKITKAIRKEIEFESDENTPDVAIEESVDDYINRNNNPDQIRRWVEVNCL